AVMQRSAVRGATVGQVPADGQVQVPGLGPVDLDSQGVEQHLRAEVGEHVRRRGRDRGAEVAGPQLHGGGEELTAPGAVLRAVAELGEQSASRALASAWPGSANTTW